MLSCVSLPNGLVCVIFQVERISVLSIFYFLVFEIIIQPIKELLLICYKVVIEQ